MSGVRLASRLEEEGVIVAPGGPLGREDHVARRVRGAAAGHRAAAGRAREAARLVRQQAVHRPPGALERLLVVEQLVAAVRPAISE